MFERGRTGAVDIVRGAAPIIAPALKQLSAILDECLTHGQPRLVLDLEKVPLIDSQGLELLLDYQERCLDHGGSMKLAAPSALCHDILTVTEVASRFDIYRDCVSAVGSFAT